MIWSGLLIYWANDVYRIGVGEFTLFPLFPSIFYDALGLHHRLAEGMAWHFFLQWFFVFNGFVYVAYTLWSGEWKQLVPTIKSLKEAWQVLLHDLYISREKPVVSGKFNGAQQIAYTVIILFGIGSTLTGYAIYKPVQLSFLRTMLGGYETARFLHFWFAMGYVLFFIIHVVQVARAGWNNFRAMVTGYENEK